MATTRDLTLVGTACGQVIQAAAAIHPAERNAKRELANSRTTPARTPLKGVRLRVWLGVGRAGITAPLDIVRKRCASSRRGARKMCPWIPLVQE